MSRSPIPPVVYAPTLRDDDGHTRLRLHATTGGAIALFVYSALDRLEAGYAADQPWVLLTPRDLAAAHREVAFDLLLVDRPLPKVAEGAAR